MSKWKAEIQTIEANRPIAIILTKSDLIGDLDDPVTEDEIKAKKIELGFQLYAVTSSKEWEDYNVHKAFSKALTAGLKFKYDM